MKRSVVMLLLLGACGESADPSSDDGGLREPLGSHEAGAGSGADATAPATPGGTQGGGAQSDAGPGAPGGGSSDSSVAMDASGGGQPGGGRNDASVTADASAGADSGSGSDAGGGQNLAKFSFFVTSLASLRELSKSQSGFGGDLRFGETGDGAGLRGADKICATIAEMSMPGSGAKGWRAFLSASTDGAGSGAVNAIDRIGAGPWYDRMGRLVATNRAGLMMTRPQGDSTIVNDLPNENGIGNHTDGAPGCTGNACPDNHDTLTGSTTAGALMGTGTASTCADWTSAAASSGKPGLGHSWPASSGMSWMQVHSAAGCTPSVSLMQAGGPPAGATGVGDGGGYGGIYCFAVTP